MEYIINFISLLIGKLGGSISPSTLSASTNFSATGTFFDGLDNLSGDDSLAGTTTISVASAVTGAANEAYDQSQYDLNASKAYVQALNEEELNYFISELEEYQIVEDINSQPKILKRALNQKNIR